MVQVDANGCLACPAGKVPTSIVDHVANYGPKTVFKQDPVKDASGATVPVFAICAAPPRESQVACKPDLSSTVFLGVSPVCVKNARVKSGQFYDTGAVWPNGTIVTTAAHWPYSGRYTVR